MRMKLTAPRRRRAATDPHAGTRRPRLPTTRAAPFLPLDPTYVAWQEEDGTSAWSVYLGDLGTLKETGTYAQFPGSNAVAARYCELGQSSIPDDGVPPPGSVRFALVTGFTAGQEGSLGTNSAGIERPNTLPCP